MSLFSKLKDALGFNEGKNPQQPYIPSYPTHQEEAVTPLSSGSFLHGSSVNSTFENAIAHAKKHGRPVNVDINGLKDVLVDPQSSVKGMMEVYNAAQKLQREKGPDAAREFLRETPEHQRLHHAHQDRTQQRTETLQRHMDMLVQDLPQRLEDGRDSTVAWIGAFSKTADNLSVGYNSNAVLSTFRNAGYDKSLVHDQSPGAAGFGNRIIGATLEQLETVGTVHPGLAKQCAEYARISSRERAQNIATGALKQTLDAIDINAPSQQQPSLPHRGGGGRGL